MNEMKPEDVMRALDCHYKEWKIPTDGDIHCNDCPYNSVNDCSVELVKDALALLREKDAEIADYIRQIAEMQREIACQADLITFLEKYKKAEADKDAEIERLQGALKAEEQHNELTMECAKKALANARAEAITEFAERLKSEVNGGQFASYKGLEIRNVIDQIAKEMKEAQ